MSWDKRELLMLGKDHVIFGKTLLSWKTTEPSIKNDIRYIGYRAHLDTHGNMNWDMGNT